MNELSNQSLGYLVQLVDKELQHLHLRVRKMDADDALLADVEQDLLDCSLVANELKALYAVAEKSSGNMPRYAQLVHK